MNSFCYASHVGFIYGMSEIRRFVGRSNTGLLAPAALSFRASPARDFPERHADCLEDSGCGP